jgi:hypothetical protein
MESNNQASVLVRSGIAKRVGRPNFSSFEASVQLELTMNLAALTDSNFGPQMDGIFEKIREQINHQIAVEIANDPFARPQGQPLTQAQPTLSPQTANPKKFGDFLREKSAELGITPEQIVRYWYKSIVDGPLTDWQQQGKVLSEMFSAGSVKEKELSDRLLHAPSI